MNMAVHFSSDRQDWATPADFFRILDSEFNFTLDVCANNLNAKCPRFFTEADDALQQRWQGRCWMNPPYGRAIGKWVAKAHVEAIAGALVVCLIPSRTDTTWWHKNVMQAHEVRCVKGRLKFDGHVNSAPFPSAVVVFRPGSNSAPQFSVQARQRLHVEHG